MVPREVVRVDRLCAEGEKIFIRGGGWTMDLMVPKSKDKLEQEFEYVENLGLNTIRLEGKFDFDQLYEAADRYGILLIPGWMCCDRWQAWSSWSKAQA